MESLILTPKTKVDLRLLKAIVKRMGLKAQVLSDKKKQEIGLIKAMIEGKKTKFVSKRVVINKLKS